MTDALISDLAEMDIQSIERLFDERRLNNICFDPMSPVHLENTSQFWNKLYHFNSQLLKSRYFWRKTQMLIIWFQLNCSKRFYFRRIPDLSDWRGQCESMPEMVALCLGKIPDNTQPRCLLDTFIFFRAIATEKISLICGEIDTRLERNWLSEESRVLKFALIALLVSRCANKPHVCATIAPTIKKILGAEYTVENLHAIIEIPMNLQQKLIPLRKRKAEEESSDDSSDAKSPRTTDTNEPEDVRFKVNIDVPSPERKEE